MNNKVFISHGDLIVDKIYDADLNLLKQDGGGCNWNDLYNLSIMGETCYAIGSVGNDAEANIALKSLKDNGVNVDYVITENKKTNIMNIIIPSKDLNDNDVIHSWYSPISLEYTMSFSNNLPCILPQELESKELYVILDKFLPVNLRFLKNLKGCHKVCLDFGHIRFFEHFTKQYISSFLEMANYVQLNETVTDLLFQRLQVSDLLDFFKHFSFDLLVLTKGKRGTTYVFCENGEIKTIDLSPKFISTVVDSSGAGDAFFSRTLREYAYSDKIDTEFVTKTFEIANKASRDVLSQVGSRIKK